MKRLLVILSTLFMLASTNCIAQLTINIRYTSEKGGARKYVRAMEKRYSKDKGRRAPFVFILPKHTVRR